MSAVAFKAFGFEDHLVRMLDRSGAPWFVAQDVCSCLQIKNHRDAVGALDDDERDGVGISDAIGRTQQTTIVNEAGVYTLALRCQNAMRPGSPAWRFRKWVTAEVLPTLRRTGSYTMPEPANDAEGVDLTDTPSEDFDERRIMLAISVVKEARQVWGRSQAQAIWVEMGLPDPRGPKGGSLRLPTAKSCEVAKSIRDWIDECTQPDPDALVASALLYRSYANFCSAREIVPEHVTTFGLSLTSLGHVSVKNGTISRRGLILI